MNGSYGVVPINQNRYLGFCPDLKMGVNIKEQKKVADIPLSRVGAPVASATPAPAIPLHEQCSDKLEPLPYFYNSKWKPVLERYCDRADFESIHNLCIGEAPSARGSKTSSERFRRQSENELGLVTGSSLLEPAEQTGASKKSVMEWSRRNKTRQVYNALRKLCKLPDKSTDEDISKRACYLISCNKVRILPDGEISFISKPVMSEAGQNDSLLNAGCIKQDDVGVSNVEDVANNEKDTEGRVDVFVDLKAQHLRRKRIQEKKRRHSINEYHKTIKGNVPWLAAYEKTEHFWVLYNACLYMKMIESKVGVKDCRSQPRARKSRHVKMTASTSQAKDLGKPAQSQTKGTSASSALVSQNQVKSGVTIRRDKAVGEGETDYDQRLSGGVNVTKPDTVNTAGVPSLRSVSECFPVLDFDSKLDIEASDCLAICSDHRRAAEPQGLDPHSALSTSDFQCETPVKADSPILTKMSATVLHNPNELDQELPPGKSEQVAVSYEKKNQNRYSCRLCSQPFLLRKALLKHLSTNHKVESGAELKLSGKRMAEIPVTEMNPGKRVEVDDPNNNVVEDNSNGISLYDSRVIRCKESNKPLSEPLSSADPEDYSGHAVQKNGVSLSPVMQADDKLHAQEGRHPSDMESEDSALSSTSHQSATGSLDLACPRVSIGKRVPTQISTRSGSQDSGIYSLDEGDGPNAESSDKSGDQTVGSFHSPCPGLTTSLFEETGSQMPVDIGDGFCLSSCGTIIPGLFGTSLLHRTAYGHTHVRHQDELRESLRQFDEVYEKVMRKHNWSGVDV
ncbi:hypothetical protein [Kistimonas asteriae]|uniref:hypothetical protein n=1 Tax=Kistimonas asteriae TaxID=517724 RepID=UPI001BAD2908|nr:hypothetical protein [Kistimonas asteriae]